MTVGEIIDEAIEATIDKLTEGTMDANVIRGVSFALEKALPALWDAEVLEMNATSGPGWMDLMEPVGQGDEGEPLDLPEGRVRFIVLPEEEKK